LAGSIQDGFNATGAETLWISDFGSEIDLVWSLDTSYSTFELQLENGRKLNAEQILGVLAISPYGGDNSEVKEKEYFRAEKRAALLAWLWSLQCPVINRIPPILWISPHLPLAFWRPALRRCGLPVVDSILSNVPSELERFVSEFSGECDYVPLSFEEFYRVATPTDFEGLTKLSQFCSINLTQYSPVRYVACVVDRKIFWNQSVSPILTSWQDRLIQLGVVTGLSFLEIGVLVIGGTPRVRSVSPFPKLDLFRPDACDAIAKALFCVLRSD
jgi:hypothetical protein